MNFEEIANQVTIGAVSGVLSASVIIQRENLVYPLFFLFAVFVVFFCVGLLSLVICEDSYCKRRGWILIVISALIFVFGIFVENFLKLL